jgi:hypothetical protein
MAHTLARSLSCPIPASVVRNGQSWCPNELAAMAGVGETGRESLSRSQRAERPTNRY